jgi:hypothetical protein
LEKKNPIAKIRENYLKKKKRIIVILNNNLLQRHSNIVMTTIFPSRNNIEDPTPPTPFPVFCPQV